MIVDDAGVIIERLSFNAWGERREGDWSEADGEITSVSNRGYTGHEMDDEVGLVNMNARIYDPIIGRFLSPDALIPSPTDLQSYNRYSYVRNNPLSFTDPSGSFRVFSGSVSAGSFISTISTGQFMGGGSSINPSQLSHIPGTGGYFYDRANNQIVQASQTRNCTAGSCRESDALWTTTYNKVTDPGQINHLSARIGVVNEIIENYGGLSRGNAKDARNSYRALAAAELAANGQTQRYADLSANAAAANDIYIWLKRKARNRYARMGMQLATVAVSGAIGAAASGANATLTAFDVGLSQVGFAAINSGGDLKAILSAALTAGLGGPLHGITDFNSVLGIAAHGVVGGVTSEIMGGGFSEGFAGAAVGKAITVGFGYTPGEFHWDQFGATVAGAAIAAELSGGDPLWAATQAAVGYLTNQLATPKLVPAPASLGLPRGTMLPRSAVETMVKHQNQVKNSVPSTRSPHVPPSNSNSGKQGFWDRLGSAIEQYFGSGAGASVCPKGHVCA